LCSATGIVIGRKIRVCQHNPSICDVAAKVWTRN
jgi:hypothetical protein